MSTAVKVMAMGALALVLANGSRAHAATAEQKCEAKKLKLVAKKASCELIDAAKAETDFSKCSSTFSTTFAKVTGTCGGTEASLESQVDAFRAQIVGLLTPATNKCEAGKLKATAKKQSCELIADGKGILKGLPADFSKCVSKFDTTFATLEDGKTACVVTGDVNTIEGHVDTYVTGVYDAVTGVGATTTSTTIATTSTVAGSTTTSTTLPSFVVDVVRVGDGSENLSLDAADSVFIDKYHQNGTSAGTPIALPTAMMGSNQPFTQAGAETEGMLSLSVDGHFLALAGYAAVPGTAGVSASTVQRVVARINAAGSVDTTTVLGATAYSGNNIRGATTVDGSAFWTSGAGKTGGGIWYATLGGGTVTQVEISSITSVRAIEIFAGQLFGTGNSTGFKQVFTVGTGLPTATGQTATDLPGMSDASPFAFLLLDRNPGVPGLDTLYVADNTAFPSPPGGIQKWTFDGTTWTLVHTFASGLTNAVRGLTGFVSGSNVVLVVTTNEATANNLMMLVDDGSASPTATLITTAPTGTQFRGVALAPQ